MNYFERFFSILLATIAISFTASFAEDAADSLQKGAVQNQAEATEALIQVDSAKSAVWIKLEGDVDPSMFEFCARAIGEAKVKNPHYIIFEINTFGGRLDAAFDIVDTIMAIKDIKTIALVKKKAISAGSLIALANDELYMLEGTTIGDCAPIVQNSDGTPQIVGEKIQSPLRAKFRNLAQQNNYPELLSSAFVTPELEIYELTKKLDAGKKTERDTTYIIEKAKFDVMSDADKAFWGSPKILVKEGELLTMTDKEAIELGFSKGTFKDRADFETKLAIENRNEIETTMGEDIASAIATISGLLLILGFGALYIEFKTPGFGLFGIIGLILIGVVFFGQFAPQLDTYLPAILLIAGAALFLVEIFIMPGTFLFGLGGIVCIILALAFSYNPADVPEYVPETMEATFDATPWLFGLFYILSCAAIAMVFPIAASKYLIPLLPEGWTPMLKTDLESAASPTEAINEISVGEDGTAKTFLRPVGQAMINGKLFDVHTHGEIIEAGQKIRVESIQEGHIFVSAVDEEA